MVQYRMESKPILLRKTLMPDEGLIKKIAKERHRDDFDRVSPAADRSGVTRSSGDNLQQENRSPKAIAILLNEHIVAL
jgi:hypothetical protein